MAQQDIVRVSEHQAQPGRAPKQDGLETTDAGSRPIKRYRREELDKEEENLLLSEDGDGDE